MSLRNITDHEKITRWMQERGGVPARGGGGEGDWAVKFPGGSADLVPVSWEEFQQAFRDERLVMVVDDEPGQTYCRIYAHR